MAKRSDPQAEAIVEGRHDNPFGYLGMHKSASGLRVRTMLPGAEAVTIVDSATGDTVAEALRIHPEGLFAAHRASGELLPVKARRHPARAGRPPGTASVIAAPSRHVWQDGAWMAERASRNDRDAPISIYEVHLGSWRRNLAAQGRYLSYRELAD